MTERELSNLSAALNRGWGQPGDFHAKREQGIVRASIYQNERQRLLPVMNANTLDTALKRVAVLQESIRAFARRLLPLRAFSTVFNGVPLEGTGEVVVPYFPLFSTASTDFVAGTGYTGTPGLVQQSKKINVSQNADTPGKRKYQWLSWTSAELREQPALNLIQALTVQLEQLGVDVFNDVLSVVTAANYGAPAKTSSAAAFDSDDIADIADVCDKADWPIAGRSLMLDTGFKTSLLKDGNIKSAFEYGSPNAIQEGQVARVMGFDIYPNPRIPENGESLGGFAVYPSAILVATCAVEPTPDVRRALSTYEIITEPETGVAVAHRRWGNPDYDSTREIVEVSYGYAAGEPEALKRICKA